MPELAHDTTAQGYTPSAVVSSRHPGYSVQEQSQTCQ